MSPPPDVARLIVELDAASRAHPRERKLLVCARPAEGRELLRSLSRSGRGWVGWEPLSLRQLAHAVVGLDMARGGLRTADGFDVMAAVDRSIDAVEAAGSAGPFGDTIPGAYRDPLRRTVEALRSAGLSGAGLRAAAGADPKLRMLSSVLTAYETELRGGRLLDGAALLGLAADSLSAGPAGGGGPVGLEAAFPGSRLFLLPGLGLRGEEGRLVGVLRAQGATVLATDPVAGLAPSPGRLWAAPPGAGGPLSRLREPVARERHDAGGGDFVAANQTAGPGAARPDSWLELFAAATPADELREVIRRVVAAGVPWDQVEIVATDTGTYGTALDGLARRLGIPVTHADGLPLSRTGVGRAAEAYFRWIADGFPAEPIRQLLENGGLVPAAAGPPSADGMPAAGAPSAAALARRLRRLRIGWGYDRYLPTLDRALAAAESAEPPRNGDDESGRAVRDRELAELRALKALLAPILSATPRPDSQSSAWASRTSPALLAKGLLALLERVPEGDQVENTARAVLVERLERARATLTRETGWLAATAILRSRLDTRVSATADAGRLSPWTSTGGHLHLSGVAMGGLAARPYTFVVGLAAGASAEGASDPLLGDADKARLNRAARPSAGDVPGPLPTSAERIEAGRHALAAMLARLRGRITLSYAAWDTAEGRTVGPAPELLQALRLRDGDPSLTYEDLRSRLGRLACAVPVAGGGLVDGGDVWLEALAPPDGPLRDGRAAVRALHPGLDRGLTALEKRQDDQLTAYHGLIPADSGLDPVEGDVVLSASRLETLGQCPLKYFYQYVLAVRPVRDPAYDPERWLDALERGSLLHSVYERTLAEQPEGVDYADGAFLEHALAVLGEEIRRTLHRLPAPNDAVLRKERDDLALDVRSFVMMVREQRPAVVRTELAFGPDPDAEGTVELDVGGGRGGRLQLRGRIDRLDALDSGGLRVVDYKTGRPRGYRAAVPFDGGRRLQHLLYALAVEQLRPGDRVEASEYHFPTARGENHVAGYARAALEPGHRLLGELLDMARGGRFLATNDPADCKYCDFREVCRVRLDDWHAVESPRAAWAREHADGIEEYGPLVRLRQEYGSGA
jgi:RecB family exonuclease